MVLMMSMAKFKSLPPDLQQVVVKSAQEVTASQRQLALDTTNDLINKLRALKVEVVPVPGRPGVYNAIAYLRPWLQMEELNASLSMVAEIPSART